MRLPQARLAYDVANESQTRLAIEQADGENWKKGQDIELARRERLILRSPDGSRWVLTASDAGALTLVEI